MGLARALERRYARIDEIDALWRPQAIRAPGASASPGIFSHLQTKDQSPLYNRGHLADLQTVTWRKFKQDVLPHAVAIEMEVPAVGNFCAIATAVHADAPPVLQWDRPEQRNPFSWYVYHGGSPAHRWGLTAGWATVSAVCLNPAHWFGFENPHHASSALFVIEHAKDLNGAHLCLFPEILRADLREVRATIESHSRTGRMARAEDASACGLLTSGSSRDPMLRVTLKSGLRGLWRIDRWE